jgi:hypothetical protein
VFSSVTDISFAAGSNNISYNSINKKATFSFNFNQYYNESYYYINSAVRESVWWRGCGVWFYPGFWDFVGIFSDIFFGRLTVDDSLYVLSESSATFNIYFTRVPTFLTGLRI